MKVSNKVLFSAVDCLNADFSFNRSKIMFFANSLKSKVKNSLGFVWAMVKSYREKVQNKITIEVIEAREVYKSVLCTLDIEKLFLMMLPFVLFCVACIGDYVPNSGYILFLVTNIVAVVFGLFASEKSLLN